MRLFFSQKRFVLGGLFFLVVLFFMLPHGEKDVPKTSENQPLKVRVIQKKSFDYMDEIITSGRTIGSQTLHIRSETRGRIISLDVKKGSKVYPNTTIAKILLDDRTSRLEEAKARLEQRGKEFQISKSLSEKNFQSATQLANAKANLKSAQAALASIQNDIQSTVIRSPHKGFVDNFNVEIGSWVNTGEVIATLVVLNPLKMVGYLSEKEFPHVNPDRPVSIELSTGQSVIGHIAYLSRIADQRTRSYRIEVSFPNPHSRLPDGMTGTMRIPTETKKVHHVTPSSLNLDDQGNIGVKIVDEQNKVVFKKVDIVKSEGDTMLITGLPDTVDLITVGGSFVGPGDAVTKDVVPDDLKQPTQTPYWIAPAAPASVDTNPSSSVDTNN